MHDDAVFLAFDFLLLVSFCPKIYTVRIFQDKSNYLVVVSRFCFCFSGFTPFAFSFRELIKATYVYPPRFSVKQGA